LKTKRRREEREREKKKKEGEREDKWEKRRKQTAPLKVPSAAHAYELCSFTKRCTRAWIVFIFFARFSYVGRAFLLSPLLAGAAKCMQMQF
jgi:hypothetical protein